MANRSDFGSKCPRYIKKILAGLPSDDPHYRGTVKRLFMEAHDHYKRTVMGRKKSSRRDADEVTTTEVEVATTNEVV